MYNLDSLNWLDSYEIDRAIHRISRPWINALAEWTHFIRSK